jgi:hypothetical protein
VAASIATCPNILNYFGTSEFAETRLPNIGSAWQKTPE